MWLSGVLKGFVWMYSSGVVVVEGRPGCETHFPTAIRLGQLLIDSILRGLAHNSYWQGLTRADMRGNTGREAVKTWRKWVGQHPPASNA